MTTDDDTGEKGRGGREETLIVDDDDNNDDAIEDKEEGEKTGAREKEEDIMETTTSSSGEEPKATVRLGGANLDMNQIKEEVDQWKNKNSGVSLNLLALTQDRFQVEATIGPDYYPFQINFTEDWHPMVKQKLIFN